MNTFGTLFRLSIFGESHGTGIGIVLDGVPPGIPLTARDFIHDLNRRKPGTAGTTSRSEPDRPQLLSGTYQALTTGAPLALFFVNTNTRPSDYAGLHATPRPGHADYTAWVKYAGFADPRGGGHFSGRLTLALVAAGVVAKKIISPATVKANLIEAGGLQDIDRAIEQIKGTGDSIGGIVECKLEGLPAGLGEPFFESAESTVSRLAFSIPAIKGIEFGSGFAAARMKGSEHNDAIISPDGTTSTNHAGGINGGITNGNAVIFRVAVKPTSSIGLPQQTINLESGNMQELTITGRHDACIALRIPVVLEAAAAIAFADLLLIRRSQLNQQ